MDLKDPETTAFMLELHSITQGDPNQQVSQYDVGTQCGLDRDETSALSEELIIDEMVELKTLSGGIGITQNGITALQNAGLVSAPVKQQANRKLSDNRVTTDEDREILSEILLEVKPIVATADMEYAALEEAVIDIKTFEVQLLSPVPKTDIFRAVLISLKNNLAQNGNEQIAEKIVSIISTKQ